MVELLSLRERFGRHGGNRVILDRSATRRPAGRPATLPRDHDLPHLKCKMWGTQTNLRGRDEGMNEMWATRQEKLSELGKG